MTLSLEGFDTFLEIVEKKMTQKSITEKVVKSFPQKNPLTRHFEKSRMEVSLYFLK